MLLGIANHLNVELPKTVEETEYIREEDHEAARSQMHYSVRHGHGVFTSSANSYGKSRAVTSTIEKRTIVQHHHKSAHRDHAVVSEQPVHGVFLYDHGRGDIVHAERVSEVKIHQVQPGDLPSHDRYHSRKSSPTLPSYRGTASLSLVAVMPLASPRYSNVRTDDNLDSLALNRDDSRKGGMDAHNFATSFQTPESNDEPPASSVPHGAFSPHHTHRRRSVTLTSLDGISIEKRTLISHGLRRSPQLQRRQAKSYLILDEGEREFLEFSTVDDFVDDILELQSAGRHQEQSDVFAYLQRLLRVKPESKQYCLKYITSRDPIVDPLRWEVIAAAALSGAKDDREVETTAAGAVRKLLSLSVGDQAEAISSYLHVLVQIHRFSHPSLQFMTEFKTIIDSMEDSKLFSFSSSSESSSHGQAEPTVLPRVRDAIMLAWGSLLSNFALNYEGEETPLSTIEYDLAHEPQKRSVEQGPNEATDQDLYSDESSDHDQTSKPYSYFQPLNVSFSVEEELSLLYERAQSSCEDDKSVQKKACISELSLLCHLLGNVGSETSLSLLVPLLEHHHNDVRAQAAMAVAKHNIPEAFTAILELLEKEKHPSVVRRTLHAVRIAVKPDVPAAFSVLKKVATPCLHAGSLAEAHEFCMQLIDTAEHLAADYPAIKQELAVLKEMIVAAATSSRQKRNILMELLNIINLHLGSSRTNNHVIGSSE